jgi:heterodisulfide reductase subunit C
LFSEVAFACSITGCMWFRDLMLVAFCFYGGACLGVCTRERRLEFNQGQILKYFPELK